MKNGVEDGVNRILGVDMHTGNPLDIEAGGNLLRAFLPKASCGSVVLRLFANLQRYMDSGISCRQIDEK